MTNKRPKLQPIEGFALCCYISLIILLLTVFVSDLFLLLVIPATMFSAWLGSRL